MKLFSRSIGFAGLLGAWAWFFSTPRYEAVTTTQSSTIYVVDRFNGSVKICFPQGCTLVKG